MPAALVTGPDHIVLRVKDPVASVDWYCKNLGVKPVRLQEYQAGKVPFLSVRVAPTFLIDFFKQQEDDSPAAAGLPSAGSTARRNTGFDHFCLVVESDDIESVRQQLAAQGIQAEPQFDGVVVKRFGAQGDAHSIYICDPDSYVVELRTYAGQAELSPAADPTAADKPLTESKCDEGLGI